jgi:hypothetical protein
MAQQEEAAAKAIAENCERGTPPRGSVCWTSTGNPSPEVLKQAEAHRQTAAAHRAASQALRDAEQQACGGISAQDRDTSPFEHREDIEGVEAIQTPVGGKIGGYRQNGASIVVRAVPGMTAEWLQRLVDCHTARNAALGYAMPEMEHCPLMLKGITASVTSTGRGFVVAIRASDVDTAREILRRAQALLPPNARR